MKNLGEINYSSNSLPKLNEEVAHSELTLSLTFEINQ